MKSFLSVSPLPRAFVFQRLPAPRTCSLVPPARALRFPNGLERREILLRSVCVAVVTESGCHFRQRWERVGGSRGVVHVPVVFDGSFEMVGWDIGSGVDNITSWLQLQCGFLPPGRVLPAPNTGPASDTSIVCTSSRICKYLIP